MTEPFLKIKLYICEPFFKDSRLQKEPVGLELRVEMTPEPAPFPEEDRETWLKAPKNLLSGPLRKHSVGFGLSMWFVDGKKNLEHHQLFSLPCWLRIPYAQRLLWKTNKWLVTKVKYIPFGKGKHIKLKTKHRRHVNDKHKDKAKVSSSIKNSGKHLSLNRHFTDVSSILMEINLLDGGPLQNKSVKHQKQKIQMEKNASLSWRSS